MDFTFGIVTAGGNEQFIQTIIQTIRNENIPNYEIIIVGSCLLNDPDVTIIPFDESIRYGWITMKKNMCCQLAKYENIVLLHDYVSLSPGWYKGFLEYGNNFEYCVTKIINTDGKRYRDFCIYTHSMPNMPEECTKKALLPYGYNPSPELSKLLYISGAYYVIKKHIALKYPLDERLSIGMGEDVVLSQILAMNNIYIKSNSNSSVQLLKYKNPMEWEIEIEPHTLQKLETTPAHILEEYFTNQKRHLYMWLYNNYNVLL